MVVKIKEWVNKAESVNRLRKLYQKSQMFWIYHNLCIIYMVHSQCSYNKIILDKWNMSGLPSWLVLNNGRLRRWRRRWRRTDLRRSILASSGAIRANHERSSTWWLATEIRIVEFAQPRAAVLSGIEEARNPDDSGILRHTRRWRKWRK